jgi:hypothetical protein
MYFKFTNKKEAFDFIQLVNEGENIQPSLDDTTTSYAQPIDLLGTFYVISDDVTKKYSDAQEFDPFAPLDTTPPPLSPYAVVIPEIYQWAFPENKFVLGGFEIPLDTHNNDKVVNLAYFMWSEFRAELDSGNYVALKRSLMPLWDYVELQVINNNLVIL